MDQSAMIKKAKSIPLRAAKRKNAVRLPKRREEKPVTGKWLSNLDAAEQWKVIEAWTELERRRVLSAEVRRWLCDAIDPDAKAAIHFDIKSRRGQKIAPPPSIGEQFAIREAGTLARSMVASGIKYKIAVYKSSRIFGLSSKAVEREYTDQKTDQMPIQPISFFHGGAIDERELEDWYNECEAWRNQRYAEATDAQRFAEAEEIAKDELKDAISGICRRFLEREANRSVEALTDPIAALINELPPELRTNEFVKFASEALAQRFLEDVERRIADQIKEHLLGKTTFCQPRQITET
jgi:hypothetical protein